MTAGRGLTQFTITNLTGRPTRARLLPRALQGADASWIQLPRGSAELPLGVGETASVDVAVVAPGTAPGGSYLLRLDAVPEDDTEAIVTGPVVAFTLQPPAAPPPKKRGWLLWLIIGVVVLALASGLAIYFLTRPKAPVNSAVPTITGPSPAPLGARLTATEGRWKGAAEVQLQWRRCQPTTCVDIAGETGTSYTVADADLGQTLVVVAVAWEKAGKAGRSTTAQSAAFTVAQRPSKPTFTAAKFPTFSKYLGDPTYYARIAGAGLEDGKLVVNIESFGKGDLRRPETSCVQVLDSANALVAQLPLASFQLSLDTPGHFAGDLLFDPGSLPPGEYVLLYSCAGDYSPAPIGRAAVR